MLRYIIWNKRKLLFLGDASEEQILRAIKSEEVSYFDVIKLSHHGSLKNANKLFDFIDGEIFLISPDGMVHNHPDIATLAKIISKPCRKTRKIIFNYPNKAYYFFNNELMMKKYQYIVQLLKDNEPITIL